MSIEGLTWCLGMLLLLFSFAQFGMVFGFCNWLSRFPSTPRPMNLPHAAIILSVRGESQSLCRCLNALRQLDYPSFEVHIVVDNAADQSLQTVNAWKENTTTILVQVHVLKEISPFASLKTSAVRQCIKTLEPNVKAIAILDADTMVHKDWLTNLVTPLMLDHVGACTGNRWYDSTALCLGNQIRFLYNAWAVPGMHFMNTVWGGSLGVSPSVFRDPDFLEKLANTPTEESGVQDIRKTRNLQLVKHGGLMMKQYGDITTADAFGFITRQLVWTRLHYREWLGVLIGPLVIYSVTVGLAICGTLAATRGNGSNLALATSIFLAYWIVNWFLIVYLDRSITKKLNVVGEPIPRNPTWISRLVLFLMIPIGFVIFVCAILKAQFARTIRWSGITYRLRPPRGVEIVEYVPHSSSK